MHSPIVKALLPEERLAHRMVKRYSLQPPVDVELLTRTFADVTDKIFPAAIDGLCLDLKVPGKRPKVWISKNLHHLRRRFTLAHEIGHIIIPWHTGSIVDDLEAPRIAKGRYKTMEAEANRFAAELLMPHDWVLNLNDRCVHIFDVFRTIRQIADVSFDAALYRTLKFGKPGYIVAQVKDGEIVTTKRTRGTRTYPPEIGTLVSLVDIPTADAPAITHHADSRYFFWQVDSDVEAGPLPDNAWRDILADILSTLPVDVRHKTLTKVNAVVGYAIGRLPKGSPEDELYGRALAATKNRVDHDPWLHEAISHTRFNEYLLARCYERSEPESGRNRLTPER